jgi:phenylalanyl-tRNA synthetase beta chain
MIDLDGALVERVLGIPFTAGEIERILGDLGFACTPLGGNHYRVSPPGWRPDVEIPEDLVEELGRIAGYDRLPTTFLRGALPPAEPRPLEDLRERVRDLAVAAGFQEIITYTLTDLAHLGRVVDPTDGARAEPLSVVNPVAAQHTYLRTSLRAGVLETYAQNRRDEDGALRIVEIGAEYLPREAELPHERQVLCGALGGARLSRWGRPTDERLDFFDAKGAVEGILGDLGIGVSWGASEVFGLLPGHTATLLAGKKPVGVVAQVHPETAAAFDIDEPVFLVELWLEDLVPLLPERPAYTPVSRFPEVRQDLALVVANDTTAGRVLDIVRSHRSGSVRLSGELFDEYRGAGVPEGKKSLALRLRYQATDRTLTDEDVTRIQKGLLTRLAKELGATLRG